MQLRTSTLLELLVKICVELLLLLNCRLMLLLRHPPLHCLILVIDWRIHNDNSLILFNQIELGHLLQVLSALRSRAFFQRLGIDRGWV